MLIVLSKNFHKPLQDLFAPAPSIQRYAAFAGSRLPTVTSKYGNIALIGDASHPLSGAFGAGAGFALEDAYTLVQSLVWAHARFQPKQSIAEGLELFDGVRSPHYRRLYDVLDGFKGMNDGLADPHVEFNGDEEVAILVATNWARRHNWIYDYAITEEFPKAVALIEKKLKLSDIVAGKERRTGARVDGFRIEASARL
jgi:salicylate hydroxylase